MAITSPAGATGYLDITAATADDRAALEAWLADATVSKAVHDQKSSIHALRRHHWELAGVSIDIALAGYLLDPSGRDFTLSTLSTRHLTGPRAQPADAGTLFADNGQPPTAAEAKRVAELADVLSAELVRSGMDQLHRDIELPTAATLAAIEQRGVAVDNHHLNALRDEFAATTETAAAAAADILGRPINLGSTQQLQKALFDDLALPRTRRIKSGFSTAADELARLLNSTGHPFVQHVLDYRSAITLVSTIESLRKHITADGRIHTTLQQMTVETGRLSSTAPNLQNIPIRTHNGARIREAFVPGAGYDLMLTADYKQIEMRIMAHASGDRHLIDAFASGDDMHRYVASLVFGVPTDEVTQNSAVGSKPSPTVLPTDSPSAAWQPTSESPWRPPASTIAPISPNSAASATISTAWSKGHAAPATPRHCSAAAAIYPASTARILRPLTPPNAPRSTRRYKAPPPTSSNWP